MHTGPAGVRPIQRQPAERAELRVRGVDREVHALARIGRNLGDHQRRARRHRERVNRDSGRDGFGRAGSRAAEDRDSRLVQRCQEDAPAGRRDLTQSPWPAQACGGTRRGGISDVDGLHLAEPGQPSMVTRYRDALDPETDRQVPEPG